jgi:DNA-binding CsgD family transcriptional regulator
MDAERFSSDRAAPEAEDVDLKYLLEAVINLLPQAILVVSRARIPLFMNAAAKQLLERADALLLNAGKLTARNPRDKRRLASCLEELGFDATDGADRRGEWLRIERRSGMPYAVFLAPLCSAVSTTFGASRPALVIVLDVGRQMSISPVVLEELFRLTPAEARLACILLRGQRIDAAAELLAVSVSTIRTQVRAIFAKLHLTRQQELVRVLSALSTIMPESIS